MRWKFILYLIAANVLWAGNYLAGRVLRFSMGPFTLNGVRWIISAVVLWLIVRKRGEIVPLLQEWKAFLLLGFIGMFLFSSLTYWGLTMVPAGEAGLLSGFTPLAVLVAGFVIAQDKVRLWQWLMVAVSIGGEILLLGGGASTQTGSIFGAVVLIFAALSWGVYTALGRRYRYRFSPLVLTTGAAVWGAIPSALLGIWNLSTHPVTLSINSGLALLYVSTMASVVAFMMWSAGVNRLGSGTAAPYMNLLPVFTALLAVLLLHETLSATQLEGGLIVVAGAVGAGFSRTVPVTVKESQTSMLE
ncbi:Threonine/homoserine efflux transporter RhtA [Sulfobacillus thermosulfidooxidans DSM 9293]|uniref:Threonine/homoserine efflux transporter RhtA n=1 Tax=Sulfobacillus thermosulfidooxidans (strain DSM 9293 / VKM B-1269 / AT-1) TaxID=929705 RepID=A0A1W1WKN7_SULTA|nr:DMT family transporter [Sulfobacillus thermosulfidooxidans]SMC06836.1 Threonine/homoserine efflux transporter RhtA [Sulfobacillus thermosulfidooxidans DSM 9293]